MTKIAFWQLLLGPMGLIRPVNPATEMLYNSGYGQAIQLGAGCAVFGDGQRERGLLIYASICKYWGNIKYKNYVDNSSFDFDHLQLLRIKIKIISSTVQCSKSLLSHLNNQNNNQIHIRHLYLLLFIVIKTTTTYSYLSLSLIKIEKVVSIVIVQEFRLLATVTQQKRQDLFFLNIKNWKI